MLVVENGSTDNTAHVVTELSQQYPYLQLISIEARGKGLAVKHGMLAAKGEYCLMCDADLSVPIDTLNTFLSPEMRDYDIAIGSRALADSKRIGEPIHRHLIGRVNNTIVKLISGLHFNDTQCGFKVFKHDIAKDMFQVQQVTGIAFDVELLFIATKRRYTICEMPVLLYYDADSKMRLVQDSLSMLLELWKIRQNWQRGVYARDKSHV